MLVIHIISTDDTQDFAKIYYNLDARICINPSKSVIKRELIREKDCVILIGHGTEYGLLNQRLGEPHPPKGRMLLDSLTSLA